MPSKLTHRVCKLVLETLAANPGGYYPVSIPGFHTLTILGSKHSEIQHLVSDVKPNPSAATSAVIMRIGVATI